MFELDGVLPDLFSEVMCNRQPLPTAAFKASRIFLWYDYFSCPQLNNKSNGQLGEEDDLSRAVGSILAYVARSEFFFALCPVVETENLSKVFSSHTWAQRGWCRVEVEMRKLSPDPSWIMIRNGRVVEMILSFGAAVGGPAGEGQFTVEGDKAKLAPVLKGALERKLDLLLRSGDLVAYRVLLNMQSVHLRSLPVENFIEPVPGFVALPGVDAASVAAARFMHQNGFEDVHDVDEGGWFPLHYAALGGDPLVVEGLLSKRADLDCQTRKEQPLSGTAPQTTALTISVFFKHNEAARLLISAKAGLHLGLTPALHVASHANNPDAIRMLLEAGFDPTLSDVLGASALLPGCAWGSQAAIDELFAQARHRLRPRDLNHGLLAGALFYGGSADSVQRLLQLRADVNWQLDVPILPTSLSDLAQAVGSFRHFLGQEGFWVTCCYHAKGITPLMAALFRGDHECAATLISAGGDFPKCILMMWDPSI